MDVISEQIFRVELFLYRKGIYFSNKNTFEPVNKYHLVYFKLLIHKQMARDGLLDLCGLWKKKEFNFK
jgi:hypothetical protein